MDERSAEHVARVALAAFAGWLCFWPQAGATPSPSPTAQAAVIVFAALLAFRVYLARRRRAVDAGRGHL